MLKPIVPEFGSGSRLQALTCRCFQPDLTMVLRRLWRTNDVLFSTLAIVYRDDGWANMGIFGQAPVNSACE